MMKMQKKRPWQELSSRQRFTTMVTGAVQVSLAVAAWADLARRPADQITGKKGIWAAIIAINFIGPIIYFVKGRRTV